MDDDDNKKDFLRNIAEHEMFVLMDSGIYRHIRFKKKSNNSYWFDLVSLPGLLCITGDMGTFSFRRAEDMFEFFRQGRGINPGYWGEKCVAAAVNNGRPNEHHKGVYMWDAKVWEDDLRRRYPAELVDAAKEFSFDWGADQESAFKIESVLAGSTTGFDPENVAGEVYSGNYLWCLHAIRWGIEQYDKAAPRPEAGGSTTTTTTTTAAVCE